jgi:nucleoside-diphosphate-sugar epimerase
MPPATAALPDSFRDVEHLEEVMTAPTPALIEELNSVPGDLIVLGVGGKMGPTLARMAKRAAPSKRVVGVARFSEKGLRENLQRHGVECIEADLLDRAKVEALPKLPNVVFMAGRKFGSVGYEDLTWAMNAYVPTLVAEAFAQSRIVAFSTGNVYPWVNIAHGGATEDTPAVPPPGTYANSCVARENLFQYFSRTRGTPGRIIRLNYAIDMRYGVLHDVATRVHGGKTIDLTTAQVNVIWQGDANAMILRSLARCTVPSSPLNISGPEPVSIRWLATALGKRLGKTPIFSGSESTEGWLTNTAEAMRLFGYPTVPLGRMVDWVADWVVRGMPALGKDTHYDSRDGAF